jgi:hypothetical protein
MDQRVALDAGTDPVAHARLLSRTYSAVLAGERSAPLKPRDVILGSWARAVRAGVDPDRHLAPIPLDEYEVAEYRDGHPLAAAYPLLKQVVGRLCEDSYQVMVVTDGEGQILWLHGHPRVKRLLEDIHFVEGATWSEDGAATNAIGTALVIDDSVQVFSAEHYLRRQHLWTCSACPIHDPDGGAQLGVIDLSGPLRTAHPDSVALVESAARMVEELLRRQLHKRDDTLRTLFADRMSSSPRLSGAVVTRGGRVLDDEPHGWAGATAEIPREGGVVQFESGAEAIAEAIPGGLGHILWRTDATRTHAHGSTPVSPLSITALGRRQPEVLLGGTRLRMTQRCAEVLCLLVLEPDGLSGEEIAAGLYGPGGNPISARAEVSRLRKLLGHWLATKPYRLLAHVDADFADALRLARAGRVDEARELCARGSLMPRSTAPAIVAAREELAALTS